MNRDRTKVLQLLKKELEFLDNGGYKHIPNSQWRPAYIFEESPSCPNFQERARPHLCEECWLSEFIPPDAREEQVPCRFIELGASGVTVDSLYRCGTPAESEEELRKWLHQRIRELEQQVQEIKELPA